MGINWFEGGIGPAIQTAKSEKKVFVVAVLGKDDGGKSEKFLQVLNSNGDRFTNFVVIKVENGTTSGNQFSQIYPVVLVPSLYFIDSSNGVDIEVTGGEINDQKLEISLNKVKERISTTTTTLPPATPATQATPAPPAPSVNNDVVSTTTPEEAPMEVDSQSSSSQKESLEERVQKAKQLLAERQAAKAKEAEEKEKNREMERREAGKSLQKFKEEQNERAIKQQADERKKEKEEERLARERVKAQIAQDRLERAAKFEAVKSEEKAKLEKRQKEMAEAEAAKSAALAAQRSTVARIQFRLPDGRTQTQHFEANDQLGIVYDFVKNEITLPFTNFSLSTTFPKMELDKEDPTESLKSLSLAPSATIMILPKSGGGGGALSNTNDVMSYVWLLLTPLTVIWNMISSFFNSTPTPTNERPNNQQRKRSSESSSSTTNNRPQTAYKRRAGVRRDGNIGRLSNQDDDDESNTYNGNSTQQM